MMEFLLFGGSFVALVLLILKDRGRFGRDRCIGFCLAWAALIPVGFTRAAIQGYPEASGLALQGAAVYGVTVLSTLGRPALLLVSALPNWKPALSIREQRIVQIAPWIMIFVICAVAVVPEFVSGE